MHCPPPLHSIVQISPPVYLQLHHPLPTPLHPIQPPRSRNLRPRPLPPDRQTHRMSPSPIRAHIPQSRNSIPHLPPQIVFNLHVGQLGGEVEDSGVFEGPDFGPWVNVEFGHEGLRDFGADAKERFEGALGKIRECGMGR